MSKPTFPTWIRRAWPSGAAFQETKALLEGLGLHTVCQSAHCPNQGECWERRTATFMILGNTCTRRCRFCAVNTGAPEPPGTEEPGRVAAAVQRMELRHVVITSVTRDDLPDGGAGQFAQTVVAVKEANPGVTVEVLVPDFQGKRQAVARVLDARPEVFGHNIETVERRHASVRDQRYSYRRSLEVLRMAVDLAPGSFIKSGFMLGLGETAEEVRATLRDLRGVGCTVLAIGQYLQPTPAHEPVSAFVPPETFDLFAAEAYSLGYVQVVSGPLVRSSYRAEAIFAKTGGGQLEARNACGTK